MLPAKEDVQQHPVYHVFTDEGRSIYLGSPKAVENYLLNNFRIGQCFFIEVISEREYRSRIILQLYTSCDLMVPKPCF